MWRIDFYVQKEQYKKDIGSFFLVELCSLCLRTQARCHSFKNPTPKHTSQNNAHTTHTQRWTMAKGQSGSDPAGRSGDDDRRDSDDDRPGGNVGRQGGDATPRTSKRNMQSTGTPAKKKTKGKTAETPTGPKRNNGNDDNVISQGGATDKKAAEDRISAENNSNATDNNVEVKKTNNNSVSKPGFSYLE